MPRAYTSLVTLWILVSACAGDDAAGPQSGSGGAKSPASSRRSSQAAEPPAKPAAAGAGGTSKAAAAPAAGSGGRSQGAAGRHVGPGDVTDPTVPTPDASGSEDEDAGTAPTQPDAGPSRETARWTAYGFDHANTQVNPLERTLHAGNVHLLQESWRLRMPDGATSTPAVADGVAYFGGWNGNIYAVDAVSGELRWQRRVTAQQANSTPLIVGDRLYVAAGASVLALARSDGSTLWESLLDTHPAAMIWSSPKLVDGMLILGVASFEIGITFTPTFIGSVVALEAENGEEIWRVRTSGETGFGPCVGAAGASVWSTAAIDEELGLAFIGTGQGFAAPASTCSDSLLALDYRRGHTGLRIRWFHQYTRDDVFGLVNLGTGPDADVGAAPNLFEAGGRALVGAGDKGGSYRVFDRKTGELVWRVDFPMGPFVQFGGVVNTAAVHGDTIYVASNRIQTAQWVSDGVHDPNDVATLYALDTATGLERWKAPLDAPMAGTFAIANGVLYHPIVNRSFYARDLATGNVLWSTKLGNDPGAGPSVVDGRVFVSAGMALTAILPTDLGGFVSSFALDAGPVVTREARADRLETLDETQCRERLAKENQTEACAACLCGCDATAAGHCGSCSTLASCAVTWCSLAEPGAPTRQCLADFCNAKLLPSFVFDRAVELAPCTLECARTCGF